jgi:hypothetical protein
MAKKKEDATLLVYRHRLKALRRVPFPSSLRLTLI